MDQTGILILVAMLACVGAFIGWWRWQQKKVQRAKEWPRADGVIESGDMETCATAKGAKIILPVFSFSYVVGDQYYSGRFALLPYITDPGPSITNRLVGHRLTVAYDPAHPEISFVPDELIEGCKVEQRLGPHLLGLYPRD